MYKHCNTEESAQRQRQLEHCLLQQMLAIPYAQITIGHICDQAGVSRKSFYRYFGSKEGCLFALIDHTIIDGASYYLPDHHTDQSQQIICERFFVYWKEQSALLDALKKNALSLHLAERMLLYACQEEHEVHKLLGSSQTDSYERLTFMISGIMGMVLSWHHRGYPISVQQMAKTLINMNIGN